MTTRKASRRGRSKSQGPQLRAGGVVDLELHCLICCQRLYVPDESLETVLTSLEQTGVVILICPGGHAQLVGRKRLPGQEGGAIRDMMC
jgi:hypothetical protein